MNMDIRKAFIARDSKIKFLFLCLFLALWASIHFPWIAADGGNPTIYEYGYFATDEGFYLGGAKEKLCFEKFIDVGRGEAFAWALSPAMSVLSWFSFRLFGQEYWAARLPFFLLNLAAWLILLRFLSRKTLPLLAFGLCAIAAFNPYMITYARTASTDIAIGSTLVIAYCVGRKKEYRYAILSGFIFGFAVWFKTSVYAFIPITMSAAFAVPTWRCRIIRAVNFMLGFVAAFVCYKAGVWLCLHNDAVSQNTSVEHLFKITANSYALPNPFDFSIYPAALSSFPRYPTIGFLGCFFVLSVLLSALFLVWRLFNKRFCFDHRILLYTGVLLYAGAIAMMNTYYTHYFIPLVMMTPILLVEAREDLEAGVNVKWKSLVMLSSLVMIGLCIYLFMEYESLSQPQLQKLLPIACNQYNFPRNCLWSPLLRPLLVSGCVLFCSSLLFLIKRFRLLSVIGLGLSCFGIASVMVAQLPALAISKVANFYDSGIALGAIYTIMLGIMFLPLIWGLPKFFSQSKHWYLFIFIFFALTTALNPALRKGYIDLGLRTYLHKNAGRTFAALVPENAIVIGESAAQLLFESAIRPMSMANYNPVDNTVVYHKKHPHVPLYAILPAGHHHLKAFVDAKDKVRLTLIQTVKAPGSGSFDPVDHYLVKIDFVGD